MHPVLDRPARIPRPHAGVPGLPSRHRRGARGGPHRRPRHPARRAARQCALAGRRGGRRGGGRAAALLALAANQACRGDAGRPAVRRGRRAGHGWASGAGGPGGPAAALVGDHLGGCDGRAAPVRCPGTPVGRRVVRMPGPAALGGEPTAQPGPAAGPDGRRRDAVGAGRAARGDEHGGESPVPHPVRRSVRAGRVDRPRHEPRSGGADVPPARRRGHGTHQPTDRAGPARAVPLLVLRRRRRPRRGGPRACRPPR